MINIFLALHCWECQNAASEKQCLLKGKLTKCSTNEVKLLKQNLF